MSYKINISIMQWLISLNILNRSDPARPLMTVTGFLGSVQNCSSTGEKASLLLSNCKRNLSCQLHNNTVSPTSLHRISGNK